MNARFETIKTQEGLRLGLCSSGIAAIANLDRFLNLPNATYARAHRPKDFDVFIGWGNKPSGRKAVEFAEKTGKSFLLLEDAFLRSVAPQSVGGEPPLGLIIDDEGIYYDASRPSRFERLVKETCASPYTQNKGHELVQLLRRLRLSKYNNFTAPEAIPDELRRGGDQVLVVDQTWQDQSVAGAGADESTFAAMIQAANEENPGSRVIVKLHPEVLAGTKRGYLKDLASQYNCSLLTANINPWQLFENVSKVYTVSSQLGFDALMAGTDVRCFGMPFYAGWGLTTDEATCSRRAGYSPNVDTLADATYFQYTSYLDAYDKRLTDPTTTASQLAFLRDVHTQNKQLTAFYQITSWKRKRVRAMFAPGLSGKVFFRRKSAAIEAAAKRGGGLVAWSSRIDGNLAAECAARGVTLHRLEDGFIRSVGLGASFHLPMSLILDDLGIYYDPRTPSRLEHILQNLEFDAQLIARSSALIKTLVEKNITKYNLQANCDELKTPDGRCAILVPGQVDNDASIRFGGNNMTAKDLLQAVRSAEPDSYIIFKPHPDVVSGLRPGLSDPQIARIYCDQFATDVGIERLIDACDEIHTISSLTGFEALMRGKKVSCYGMPFYAGWGLTTDTQKCPRRTRTLTLEQLIAATLIQYPRYFDPKSNLPCSPN